MQTVKTTFEDTGIANRRDLKATQFYEQLLAVLGVELENRNVSSFIIEVVEGSFIVKAVVDGASAEEELERDGFWRRFGFNEKPKRRSGSIELCYATEELGQMAAVPGRHLMAATRLADFLRLAHQLATVGSIMDRKRARLMRIDRTAPEGLVARLTVHYITERNARRVEEYSSAALYDFSVQRYMHEKRDLQSGKGKNSQAA